VPNIDYLGLDLAAGMVEFARDRFPGEGQWLVGDAEQLPLAANSVDLVFSSLAIQWCSSPHRVFAELARVLRPGGQCVFTSLGPETLRELRDSWASVDDYQHVNQFISSAALQDAAAQLPGIALTVREQSFAVQYDRVGELLRELKVLGAHNMNRGRAEGLTTKAALQRMYKAYEQWRSQGKLPATYDVQFGMLEKQR
jgi:malonyl-CoA O-methyltransferase